MKKLVLATILLFLSASVQADTIYFSNGASAQGHIVSQNNETVTIDSNGKKTTYSMKDIKTIQPDQKVSSPPPPPVQSSQTPQTQATQEPAPTAQTGQPTQSSSTTSPPTTQSVRSGPRLVGPAGATGVIRRHERREVRRGATTQ